MDVRPSLRLRVLAVVLLAATPPLVLLAWSALSERRCESLRQAQAALTEARTAAVRGAALIEGAEQALRTIAGLGPLRRWDRAACASALGSLAGAGLPYREALVAAAGGDVLCRVGGDAESLRMAQRLLLEQAARSDTFVLGDYRMRDGLPVVAAALPVADEAGGVRGAAVVVFDVRGLALPAPGAALWLVDRDGTIVTGAPDPEKWTGRGAAETPFVRAMLAAGREGTLVAPGPDGRVRVFGYAALGREAIGPKIAVGLAPPAGADPGSPARIAVALAATLLLLGGSWLLGERLLRPVPGASGAGPAEASDAFGRLARAYEEMADSLERSDARLRSTLADLDESVGFRMLVEGVKEYAIFMIDGQGHVISWNAGAERIKGHRPEEILGRHFSSFYAPDDVEHGRPQQDLAEALENGRAEAEEWRVRRDGSRFWASVVTTPIRDEAGRLRGFSQVTRDLTERRQAEATLRSLSQQLLMAQEEERRRIARELHDEIGQVLTTVKINLQSLQRLSGGELGDRLEGSVVNVDRAIQDVRSLSLQLRPPLLDELGLPAAVRWYAHRQATDAHLELEVEVDAVGARVPAEVEVGCFRVAQEAVTNVVRHARARRLYVGVHPHDGGLELVVRDDGAGFQPDDARQRSAAGECMGLSGMQERVSLLGGRLEMRSSPGAGTEIRAWFPTDRTNGNGKTNGRLRRGVLDETASGPA